MNETSDKFIFADDVKRLAARLIQDHHNHLIDARIVYLFRMDDWEKNDIMIGGSAKAVNQEGKFLTNFDFIITINYFLWNMASEAERVALVDHQLTHCNFRENSKGERRWCIIDHDVNEFSSIVSRYGMWDENLRKMEAARQKHHQLTLAFDSSSKTGTEG